MQSFSASFEQRVENEYGQALEESQGIIHLKRPRALLWQTYAPFPLIVSTNETSVLVYDQDLAQVTELNIDEVLTSTPAGIILTAGEGLGDAFEVAEVGARSEGDFTYTLMPLADDAEFMRIDMTLDDLGLLFLKVEDALGNRTSVSFHDRRVNEVIADEVFDTSYPEGIDWVLR